MSLFRLREVGVGCWKLGLVHRDRLSCQSCLIDEALSFDQNGIAWKLFVLLHLEYIPRNELFRGDRDLVLLTIDNKGLKLCHRVDLLLLFSVHPTGNQKRDEGHDQDEYCIGKVVSEIPNNRRKNLVQVES